MGDLLDLASGMERTVSASSLRSFCELAKIDHLIFKFRVYQVLLGLSQEKEEQFSDHAHCRLGKWYYQGDGQAYFSSLPGFRNLEAPHKEVHDSAHGALAAHRQGDGQATLAWVARMETSSLRVLEALEGLAVSGAALFN
ncbi:MAG: CZB domain-containing protein [Pseudomonadota bacterium]